MIGEKVLNPEAKAIELLSQILDELRAIRRAVEPIADDHKAEQKLQRNVARLGL